MTKRTITICGKDVEIFYCAATENGFERMTDKNIGVFLPTFKKNEKGETVIDEMPKATNEDYLYLALAGIVAADTYYEREAIITSKEIVYDATPAERNLLLNTIIELRSEWYEVPKLVANIAAKESKEADDGKSAKN